MDQNMNIRELEIFRIWSKFHFFFLQKIRNILNTRSHSKVETPKNSKNDKFWGEIWNKVRSLEGFQKLGY